MQQPLKFKSVELREDNGQQGAYHSFQVSHVQIYHALSWPCGGGSHPQDGVANLPFMPVGKSSMNVEI